MSGKAKASASSSKASAATSSTKAKSASSSSSSSSSSSKKSTSSSSSSKKKSFAATHAHLFEKKSRSFGIGRSIPPTRDLSRYVRWPKYIRLQRQRAILKQRLKVPPAINQFSRALDKNAASTLFRLLAQYRPESHIEKKKRLQSAASSAADKKELAKTPKPLFVKYGLNHITHLVETKKAKLVVIAHDVEPIELVVWLPALCRKMNIPYVIVKGKSRLGYLVYKKTATALAVTETRKEDAAKLEQLLEKARTLYNDNAADRKKWGGGVMGIKAQHVQRERQLAVQKELASKGQA